VKREDQSGLSRCQWCEPGGGNVGSGKHMRGAQGGRKKQGRWWVVGLEMDFFYLLLFCS
jgi:hypothetical protein